MLLELVRFSLALPVLLAAAAACSSGGDDTLDNVFDACQPVVIVPEEASADETASIVEALDLWNRYGETRLTLDEVDGAPHLPVRFDDAASSFHGLYDDEHAIVFINHALSDPRERAIVVSHELGHAFGLFHVSSGTRVSVMNAGNLTVEPNDADNAAVIGLWGSCR